MLNCDAKILRLQDGTCLAITTDSVMEEIAGGVYTDPYLIGWMTVMTTMSDLASVGAIPIGIMIMQSIPSDYPEEKLKLINNGIKEACRESGTFVLGGDMNRASELQLKAVAIGSFEDKKRVSPLDCQENDLLLISNPMGSGMGFALTQLFYKQYLMSYKPTCDLARGQLIRKYASSCIDTSNGFFPALCSLIESNNLGFRIHREFSDFVDYGVKDLAQKVNLPDWFFLAGPHGEYELAFTLPPSLLDEFMEKALELDWEPSVIGSVIKNPEIKCTVNGTIVHIDKYCLPKTIIESEGIAYINSHSLLKLNQTWVLQ
jgi:thiamine-monophosphate kinase